MCKNYDIGIILGRPSSQLNNMDQMISFASIRNRSENTSLKLTLLKDRRGIPDCQKEDTSIFYTHQSKETQEQQ